MSDESTARIVRCNWLESISWLVPASSSVEGLEAAGLLHFALVGWLPLRPTHHRHARAAERARDPIPCRLIVGNTGIEAQHDVDDACGKCPAAPASVEGMPAGVMPASCCKRRDLRGQARRAVPIRIGVSDKDPFTLKPGSMATPRAKGPSSTPDDVYRSKPVSPRSYGHGD